MIAYLKGDATEPVGDGPKIIAHICNDIGAWGSGFVMAISKKWKEPEIQYRTTITRNYGRLHLGSTRLIKVEENLSVCNMIAQSGIRNLNNPHPLQYGYLALCLAHLAFYANYEKATIHMPRIGCGLGGGSWDQIEPIIQKTLKDHQVFVYDLP